MLSKFIAPRERINRIGFVNRLVWPVIVMSLSVSVLSVLVPIAQNVERNSGVYILCWVFFAVFAYSLFAIHGAVRWRLVDVGLSPLIGYVPIIAVGCSIMIIGISSILFPKYLMNAGIVNTLNEGAYIFMPTVRVGLILLLSLSVICFVFVWGACFILPSLKSNGDID